MFPPGRAPYEYIEEDVKCRFCGKAFSTPGSRHRHEMTVHHKSEPLQCEICKGFYKNKNSLTAHKSQAHGHHDSNF